MTAIGRRNEDASVQTDQSSLVRVEVECHHDLCATPPAYTPATADGEETLDAEAFQQEKAGYTVATPTTQTATSPIHASSSNQRQALPSSDLPPDYYAQLTKNAANVHAKRCTLLPDRPATWLVKREDMALCPLAAAVLIKEGLVRQKDLQLVSRSSGAKRDPTDPLSAVALGVYDTVGDIMYGLAEGPIEFGKHVGSMSNKQKDKKDDADQCYSYNQLPQTTSQEASLLDSYQDYDIATFHGTQQGNNGQDAEHTIPLFQEPEVAESQSNAPTAAKHLAIGTTKGIGRIIGASLKAPMTFTHGVTRGFHNAPKLYGEEVRDYENVVDLKSGLTVSAKSLGYGLYEGLTDIFVKPVEGAQKEGILGFGKGFGQGIGSLICKPAAGIVGIVGYPSVGVYKEIQGLDFVRNNAAVNVVVRMGEAELEQAGDSVKSEVVQRWVAVTLRRC